MKNIIRFTILAATAFSIAACTTTTADKIEAASANYQRSVAAINADIAAASPVVARNCTALAQLADIAAKAFQSSDKYGPAFAAASGGVKGYCQAVPTDIQGVAVASAAVYAGAKAAYDKAKAGG